MTVKTFALKLLSNPSVPYYSPGQVAEGTLHIVNDQECTTKGIRMRFSGNENVNFDSGNTRCIGKREYFNVTVYFLGDGRSNVTLPAGERLIPFQFPLPHGIPSSFFGKHGEIVYELEAVMERSCRINERSQVLLYVRGIVELNSFPNAIQPWEARKSKTVTSFFCCQGGPISSAFKFPRRGFIPGEYIEFLIELTNRSNKHVTRTCVKVMQEVAYRVKGVVQTWGQCICTADGPTVPAGKSVLHRGNTALRIPTETPPTRPAAAHVLISFQYFLRVVMDIGGFSLPLEGDFPIFIGTVPFGISSSNQSPALRGVSPGGDQCDSDQQPLLASSEDEPGDTCPDYLPPPSYDEAVHLPAFEGIKTHFGTVRI